MLPVELVAFSAAEKNESVYLSWTTASEVNNQYFQIEHSIDGMYFEKIEQVDGVGHSDLMNHYNFIHKDSANGVNYYRLKQVDFDGRFEYSDIVSVQWRILHFEASVYPNPSTGKFTIKLSSVVSDTRLELFDVSGQLIESKMLHSSNSTIDLTGNEAGIYFVRIISSDEQYFGKVVLK